MRLYCLTLFAVGPVVALLALLRRGPKPRATLYRAKGWRACIPAILHPVEWLFPPALMGLAVGEIAVDWLPLRLCGLSVAFGGAVLLAWSSVVLGRFFVHEAAVLADHALVTSGPYRFIRHPI